MSRFMTLRMPILRSSSQRPMQSPTVARLLWLEPIWILMLSPFLLWPERLVPSTIQPFLVGALFAFWPLRLAFERRIALRTPLDGNLSFLLLWLPFTIFVSTDQSHSWAEAGYLLVGITLYFALINWPTTQQYPWLIVCGIGLLCLGIVTILLLSLSSASLLPGLYKLRSDFSSPWWEMLNDNAVAGYLELLVPILVALALYRGWSRKRLGSWVMGVLAILLIAAIIPTLSRGSYAAVSLALGAVILLRWPRRWPFVLILFALVGGILYWINLNPAWKQTSVSYAIESMANRNDIYERSIEGLINFPLSGIGFGLFHQVVPILHPSFVYNNFHLMRHAHNLFLQIGLELGIPGLLAYIGLLGHVFIMLGQSWRQSEDVLSKALATGTLGAFVSLVVHGLVDATTWGNPLAFIPWLLIALTVLLYIPTLPTSKSS